ncbi:hypothetical protein ES703_125560 [subsurface metagenome]
MACDGLPLGHGFFADQAVPQITLITYPFHSQRKNVGIAESCIEADIRSSDGQLLHSKSPEFNLWRLEDGEAS